MGGLPRPDVPPGPRRDLVTALHELHHRAGWPSLRTLARQAGCSHTTVSTAFSSPKLPSWGVLELLVEAMDGDTGTFHDLWLAASTPTDRTTPPRAPLMAGRRDELTAVRRHLEHGTGLLLVTGEAGIGKTKLVTTAAALSTATFTATGSCLPLSSEVPLLPIADALRAVYESDGGQLLEKALSGCAAYVAGSLSLLVPELAPWATAMPESGADWAQHRLFAAVGSTLRALSAQRPIGLLVEDLHWADSATLDLLEHLVTRDDCVPVVGTYRLDDPTTPSSTADWCARIRRLSSVTASVLTPLSRDETAEQLVLLTGQVPAVALVDSIHRRAAGQPLFTEQLAAQAESDERLPSLLADLLDARLGDLTGPAWSAARALGVADRPLASRLLSEITGLAEAELTAGLHDLDAKRLLGPGSGQETRLRHPLLAEAIRRRLVPGEAREVHRQLAMALGTSPGAAAAEVAAHWQGAEDPTQELEWRVLAARAAAARFAKAAEAEQWGRVLALWPDSQQALPSPRLTWCETYCAAIEALTRSGQMERAAALSSEALGRVPVLADEGTARLLRSAADCRAVVDGPMAALELLGRAIAIHEQLPPSSSHALALERQAGMQRALGEFSDAAASLRTAIAILTDLDDRVVLRQLMAALAWHDYMAGDTAIALSTADAALHMELTAPNPFVEIGVAVNVTDILLQAGAAADQIEAAGQRALEAARHWEIATYPVTLVRSNVAEALTRAGRVARSAALIDPVTAGRATVEDWPVHLERALLDTMRGQLEAAGQRIDQLSRIEISQLGNRVCFAEYAAAVDLWRGRPADALARAIGLLEEATPTEVSEFVGIVFTLAARAAADLPAPPTRRSELLTSLGDLHANASVDPFGAEVVPANRFAAGATWRAELSRLSGEASLEAWARAASEWDQLTRPHDAAYCRWRGARVASENGQATLAAKLLRRAAQDAREHVPLSAAIARAAIRVPVP